MIKKRITWFTKTFRLHCILTPALFVLGFPAFSQDTATVAKPQLSPSFLLYLKNPNASFFMVEKHITLDFSVDPSLQSAQYNDALYMRHALSVENMGQQVVGNLRKEQHALQVNAVLNTVVAGFVWGMIIKENVDGYLKYKQQQQSGQQPAPPPPSSPLAPPPTSRPPELRRP